MAKKSFKEKLKYIWESPEAFRYIIIGLVVIIAVVIAIVFIVTMIDVHNEGEEINQEISNKNKACELMTDAYNKCSYSYSEKRCICKRR